ncbi:MAG: family 43 glycosylhydrolase [Mangrovibacterium sp.]
MRNFKLTYLLMLAVISFAGQACQEYGKWDSPSGNQTIPPPEVDPAFSQGANPTMGKEGGLYYIYASNAAIDGIAYQSGLLLRTTPDLVQMNIEETTAYVLSDVIDSWAGARLLQLDASIDVSKMLMGEPCLKQIGDVWYMFYSVSAGTNAAVIGAAKASSLALADWEDMGELVFSNASTAYKAASPSVCQGADGNVYMAFGGSAGGIFVSALDLSRLSAAEPTLVASRSDATVCESPELFYAEGQYNLIFTMWNGSFNLTCHAASDNPLANYVDFAGRSALGVANFWELTRVITGYQFVGGTLWETVKGTSVFEDNGRYFVLNHAVAASATDKTLHIREMHFLNDERMVHRTHLAPMLSPTRYYSNNSTAKLTSADIVGDWYYGTLWGHVNSGINDPMSFSAGGVYDGGSWDFDENTQVLHLTSTEWGGEQIYIQMSVGNDWFHADKLPVIVGSGVNDTFTDYPGVWMKKQTYYGVEEEEQTDFVPSEHGVFAPTIGVFNARFYMYSSAPAAINKQLGQGFPLLTSTGGLNQSDFEVQGQVLTEVKDWAVNRLYELNGADVDSSSIRMAQPNLVQLSASEWRLYYSVSIIPSNVSVIGFATASSPEGPWEDRGEVLSSDASSAYCANAPSFVHSEGGDYLAFGGGHNTGVYPEPLLAQSGVYGVELSSNGEVLGNAQVLYQHASDQLVGLPLFLEHGGYWHLIAMQNSYQTAVQGFSNSALGVYYEFGGRNVSDSEFDIPWYHANIFQGYLAQGESSYTNPTGGFESFEFEGNRYVVHQITVDGALVPSMQVRRLSFFESSELDISTRVTPYSDAPFPNISLAICEEALAEIYPSMTEVSARVWNYQTGWPIYESGVVTNLSDAALPVVFAFKSDGGLAYSDLSGETIQGASVWNYDEQTGVLHFQNADWGYEHVYFRIYKQNGNLVASGLNATFGDRPMVMMKQKTE